MMKRVIESTNAPKAAGPYSPAIYAGPFIFLSGQVPLDPKSGQLVSGDITQQTHQVMKNLGALLQEAEASFENVVKTTIFLTNMDDYAAVNAVYAEYFSSAPPARSTVQVAALALKAQVEIDMIAFRRPTGAGCGH
jgi:2-iminobutanoate/2-iminopropanoate deaminase